MIKIIKKQNNSNIYTIKGWGELSIQPQQQAVVIAKMIIIQLTVCSSKLYLRPLSLEHFGEIGFQCFMHYR